MKFATRDAKENFLAAMPKMADESDLVAAGYRLHHTAWFKGYISRKIDPVIAPYKGHFGTGYTIAWNDGQSTQYSRVEYWVK
jgi:hypothetical protein